LRLETQQAGKQHQMLSVDQVGPAATVSEKTALLARGFIYRVSAFLY